MSDPGTFTYRTETPVQLTPHKCPKCNACGFLSYNPALGPQWTFQSTQTNWACDVCERGIIWSRIATEKATGSEGRS